VRHGLHARISRECPVRRDASYACVVPKGIFLERQFVLPRSKPSDPSAGRDIIINTSSLEGQESDQSRM
jgi:hypothetical protein